MFKIKTLIFVLTITFFFFFFFLSFLSFISMDYFRTVPFLGSHPTSLHLSPLSFSSVVVCYTVSVLVSNCCSDWNFFVHPDYSDLDPVLFYCYIRRRGRTNLIGLGDEGSLRDAIIKESGSRDLSSHFTSDRFLHLVTSHTDPVTWKTTILSYNVGLRDTLGRGATDLDQRQPVTKVYKR